MSNLEKEIEKESSQIYRESYQMSIGELANLYRDDEIDIHPEFQRLFRWNSYQKTRLIESILLNIPIPSIFVNQNEKGVWDVIDGVQRLSTIFQFMGILKDENDKKIEPLILNATDYLPSLEGYGWSTGEKNFTKTQQLDFKRARMDVIIVKKGSDPKAKYELFQRLNTGGANLEPQEVRNCLIIMVNKSIFELICECESDENFSECVPVSDRKELEQYKKELVLRLLIGVNFDVSEFKYKDLSEMLDKEILKICENEDFNKEKFKENFFKTFEILNKTLGEDVFKKYSKEKNKFSGAILNASFQAIAVGVYKNLENIKHYSYLENKIIEMYDNENFNKNLGKGVKPVLRFRDLSLFGEEYFRNEDK